MKNTSPQALSQAKLEPKDPFDPKQLLGSQNPLDPDGASNASAAKAPGIGLRVDFTA